MSSHLYFIDSGITRVPKTEEKLVELEKNIVELGIAGSLVRLSPLKTIQDTLSSRNFQNIQTIVGVGGDELFFDLLDCVCDKPLVLGMIALIPSPILKQLGVPLGLDGCKTIAHRITKSIDCGRINQKYFFSSVIIPFSYEANLDGRFNLSIDASEVVANDMFMRVVNIDFNEPVPHQAERLKLEVVKKTKKMFRGETSETQSSFIFSKLKISGSSEEPVVADGQKTFKPPLEITAAPQSLKMIVGKNRHPMFG
ncbi:MAG: hypothetical protein AAB793_02515, partial [Patescibacteria group bacterium]